MKTNKKVKNWFNTYKNILDKKVTNKVNKLPTPYAKLQLILNKKLKFNKQSTNFS